MKSSKTGKGARPVRMRLHTGHRMRLRRKAARRMDALEDHEAVEVLLFESIRRRNTNETAHRLAESCDSLLDLLRMPPEALEKTPGIGPASARLIASVLPRAADMLTAGLCAGGEPLDRWSLLPAADLRLNRMGECGALLTLSPDGCLSGWIPSADTDELIRLSRKTVAAPRAVLVRESAAREIGETFPDLRAAFPGAERIFVLTPERELREIN